MQGQGIPQARVRKIMKLEEFLTKLEEKERIQKEREEGVQDLKSQIPPKFMISQEAPILMSKACELIIRDITTRAWKHTLRNRRKTLSLCDIHNAVGDDDVFDFLIDIVPRVTKTYAPPMDPHALMQVVAQAGMHLPHPTNGIGHQAAEYGAQDYAMPFSPGGEGPLGH